jgi:AcrR family transcriptional regulator
VKKQIIKVADEMFTNYGLKSVTMDDIAKKMGISKKTIYQFYKDKDELVELIVRQKLDEQWCEMEEIGKQYPNPIEEVLRMSEYIRKQMTTIHPSVIYDMQKYFPRCYAMYNEHIERCFKDSFSKNIENGINLGVYRSNINPEILSILRIKQIEMAFNPEYFPPQKHKLQDIQYEFIIHFLYGICTIKGHEQIDKYILQ